MTATEHAVNVRLAVRLILGRARRCSGCRCLVPRDHDDNHCAWPCSPLGFFTLLGGRVQARRRWIARRLHTTFARTLP